MQRPASQQAIIDLLGRSDGLPLKDIATGIRLTPSPTLRNLRALEDEGLVERTGRYHGSRYRLAPQVSIDWTDRFGPEQVATHRAWRSAVPIDWRFPLVSRVPDAAAQKTLYRFFDHAQGRALFTPWHADVGDIVPRRTRETEQLASRFAQPSHHHGWTAAVYGSCARGDARRGSDLDLVVLYEEVGHVGFIHLYAELWASIARAMAPGAVRPINVRAIRYGQLREDEIFRHIADEILEDGITVYASDMAVPWVEVLRRHGGRP